MDKSNKGQPHLQYDKPREDSSEVDDATLFRAVTPLVSACLAANHDINNWLSGIFGYTEFLQTEADSLSHEQRKYLDKIMQCAERIQLQINKISAVKSEVAADVDMDFLVARLRGERK